MTPEHLLALIDTYKYFILFPIALTEGHMISILVGFLARTGYINPFIAGSVIISGNATGDVLLYLAGYYKGEAFVRRWGKYLGLTDEKVAQGKKLFHKHPGRILVLSKMTNGFGLQMAILFAGGLVRVPFRIYMFWDVLGEVIWTSGLIIIGYLFGHLYTTIESVFFRIGLAVFAIVIIFVVIRVRRYIITRVEEDEGIKDTPTS